MLVDAYDKMSARQFVQPYLPHRPRGWREHRELRRQRQLRKFLEAETKKGLGQTYRDYIASDRWKRFTRQIIADRGKMCERCGHGNRTLTVHHLSYVRLGNELPEDVKVYCWPCHKLMHPNKNT